MATPDGGRSYSIEVHNPLSSNKTEITHFVTCNKPKNPDDVFFEEIIEHRLRGLKPVMDEDYQACEDAESSRIYRTRAKCWRL